MAASKAPVPLLSEGEPVDWFFVFKFNAATYPGGTVNGKTPKFSDPDKGTEGTKGIFGGHFLAYKHKKNKKGDPELDKNKKPKIIKITHGQQYAVASSKDPELKKNNNECIGTTLKDPLGATFAQVYNSDDYNYLIWNDQFYGDPDDGMGKPGKTKNGNTRWESPDIPWGHSKGMLAWNNDGDGYVMQVSSPSWPASGSRRHSRKTQGNTLGCVTDNDVEVSQHFFCLKINLTDLEIILKALNNSSVVTDPNDLQIAKLGGPKNIQDLAKKLFRKSFPNGVPADPNTDLTIADLTTKIKGTKIRLISKPSRFTNPPWQLVSAKLDGLPLRVASWWENPDAIYSTNSKTKITCWPKKDLGKPGAVEIALSGQFMDKKADLLKTFELIGSPSPKGNHAKLGISTDIKKPYSIFGDMNQMGALHQLDDPMKKTKTCAIHQNGRGGLFYVVENKELFKSITSLLTGTTAPLRAPKKKPKSKKTTSKKAADKKASSKKVAVRKVSSKKAAAKKSMAKKAPAKKITTTKKKSSK